MVCISASSWAHHRAEDHRAVLSLFWGLCSVPPSSSLISLILWQPIPSLSCLLLFALPIFSSLPPLLFPRRLYFWSERFIQSLTMQSSRAGAVTGEQSADGVRHSRNQCRWSPLLLYIARCYKRGTGLWVAKQLWQKSAIPVTMANVERANTLALLQSDSQDHGTTDYALCPHSMLWHIAMFNSSASPKTKGQALIYKRPDLQRGSD